MSFLFPSIPRLFRASFDWPTYENFLTDTIDVMVERTSYSNLFLPFVPPFDFSLSF